MQQVKRLIEQFIPENYQLTIDIDRPERTFSGSVVISGNSTTDSGQISLHSKELEITSALVNGMEAAFSYGEHDELIISHEDLVTGSHTVDIQFSGKITDAMHGMYPCYFEHDGQKKELIATQFESHHAREALPCIDEPEAKATFDVTLVTEAGITVLSNQPIKNQSEKSSRLTTIFQTTPRMSTYLLAWVTGEMHQKTAKTKNGVEVSVWATPAQRPEALDFALDHSVKTIEFFDEYFDTPYPLAKCDQVALPDFSSGAMENWGLVTYRETALLADPTTTTVSSKRYIATVISHELSHMWFGNLVTMKWWDNLWLNESFATLMEYVAVDAIHPEWNAWLDFSSQESIMALRRDAIDGVQSVQVDVNHPDEISSLFDGAIVYAKGARLMRMCQEYIGHESFRKGLTSYFKEFAYGNTEADDLWRHLSEASGRNIADLMNTWISQSGYPVVSVTPEGLSQKQFFIGPHEDSSRLWPITLGAADKEDMPALLDTKNLKLPIADNERLNVKDASHFITHYTPDHLSRLLANMADINEIGRLQILHERSLLARGGMTPSVELLNLLDAYRDETRQSVWDIMALSLNELKRFVETNQAAEAKLRSFALLLARPQFERLGWSIKENEPEEDTKLRSLIIGITLYGEDEAAIKHCHQLYAKGIEQVHPEIRHLVISAVIKSSTDDSIVEDLLQVYRTTQSADLRDDICSGLTSAKQPSHINTLLQSFTDNQTIRRQDLFRWFAYLIRNRYARQATWDWMTSHWDWIEEVFTGDKSYDYFPQYSASGLMTREQLEAYRKFFEPMVQIPALTRAINLGLKEIEGRLAILEANGDSVRARLRELA